MSDYGPITGEEQAAIGQLKTKLSGNLQQYHDDWSLCQWLRAHNGNVGKTEEAFKKSAEWMKSLDLGSYNPPEVLTRYYAGGMCGYDKEGSAVRYELLGKLDLKGLMRCCRKTDMEKYKMNEYVKREMDLVAKSQGGQRRFGLTTIVDMSGVGAEWLSSPAINMYIHFVNILEENFPGVFKRLFVVNAPPIFPLLWRIARTFMYDSTKNKIHVLGANYKKELLNYIDAGELPAFLGGTRKDSDGSYLCEEMICQGGKVPETEYIKTLDEFPGMHIKEIPAGQKFSVNYDVEIAGAILSWAFRTEDNDIGFGVSYLEEEKREDIIPQKRVQSHAIVEDGSLKCPKVGTYEVTFDNSYSWTKAKKLWYLVEVHYSDSQVKTEVDKLSAGGSWANVVTIY